MLVVCYFLLAVFGLTLTSVESGSVLVGYYSLLSLCRLTLAVVIVIVVDDFLVLLSFDVGCSCFVPFQSMSRACYLLVGAHDVCGLPFLCRALVVISHDGPSADSICRLVLRFDAYSVLHWRIAHRLA